MAVPRPGNKRMANRPATGQNMRRFKPGNQQPRRMNMGGIGAMFNIINNTNQIPSNGYLDFTEPTSNNMCNNTSANGQKQFKNNSNNANGSATNRNNNKNRNMPRRNNNNGQRSSNGGMNGGNNRWSNNRGGMGNNNMNMRQGGNMLLGGQFNGPPRMHPMGPNGPMPPMLPPLPMPIHNMNGRFPPRPLMPPPMSGMGMAQGPVRRPGFRMGPGPFPNRGMLPRNNSGGPIRRSNKVTGGIINKNNRRNGGNAPNQKNRKKNQVKNGKRTNPNVNKYALDKPWVTDEIREAHQAKTDLENQLKGKKNDEIFAKFKEQRDKFVSLYDAAKETFVTTQQKDKEKVSKESDTGEQKDTNNDVEMPVASAAS